MKKLILTITLLTTIGAMGCGAAPNPTSGQAAEKTSQAPWEQIEKEVFTGHMGQQEIWDRIDKTKHDHDTKEDLRAIAYQLIYIQGMVDSSKIKEEAKTLWSMREEYPEEWLYKYDMQKTEEHDNRFIDGK